MEDWQIIIREKEFNDILMDWNSRINLVSRQKKDVFDLIEDSKLFFAAIDFKERIKILDLGTGGGFPGIVIAIHHPEARLTLVDSIQKKINFVKEAVKNLNLTNTDVICSRIEELGKKPEHKNNYDYIVARSVTVLQDLCKWSKNIIKTGGMLVTLKGGDIKGEIKAAGKLSYILKISEIEKKDKKLLIVKFKNQI